MKYEMPVLTDENREELIETTLHMMNTRMIATPFHQLAQITLAALTADKSTLGEIESGIRALKMTLTKCNRMNYCRGVLMNLDDVVAKAKERTYTAPPVPAMKPIELPGVCAFNLCELLAKDEVIAAIRAAGYEVKDE